jgi:hypothetical protein
MPAISSRLRITQLRLPCLRARIEKGSGGVKARPRLFGRGTNRLAAGSAVARKSLSRWGLCSHPRVGLSRRVNARWMTADGAEQKLSLENSCFQICPCKSCRGMPELGGTPVIR